MEALRTYLVGGAFVVATAYPAFIPAVQDGYPLSTYPMFSRDRGRETVVASVVAVTRDGNHLQVSPALIANSEAMQAVQTLNRTLSRGRRAAGKLCREIADRIAADDDPDLRAAVRVELARERVASVDFLAGRTQPHDRRVHARCHIRGRRAKQAQERR